MKDSEPSLPTDRQIDRRSFLSRMAALSAGASAGAFLPPREGDGVLVAAEAPSGAGVVMSRTGTSLAHPLHPLAAARAIRPEALADPTELTISEALALFGNGGLSPSELLESLLARIERFEESYSAFNIVLVDRARDEAERRTRGRSKEGLGGRPGGLLGGIPLAIKDNFYTRGIPTTANSHIFRDFVPTFDATCVARLVGAGAIVLGKTQMGPLATTRATTPDGEITTVNAWAPGDPLVNPGGSSSGSATAVAGRMALSGIGTQTGGSITAPANAQGLTGLKPTMGRASLYGVIPLSYTRDHPGPLARDAKDAAILLTAMAGPDPADPRTLGLPPPADYIEAADPVRKGGRPGLRWSTTIGFLPGYLDGDGAQASARRSMVAEFEALGARVVEVTPPDDWDVLTGSAFNNVRLVERTEPFLRYLKEDVRLFGVSLPTWINGALLGGDEYLKGQRARLLLLRRILDGLFRECDAVLQPSHLAFDMTGLPLIAFPIGFGPAVEGGLPIGAILGGLPFAEDRLLSLVAGYQAVTNWHLYRPVDPVPRSQGARPAGRDGGGPLSRDRGRIDAHDVMELSE